MSEAGTAAAGSDGDITVLSVHDAEVQYGVIRALQGVSIRALRGRITSVVGTNGAGKSTLLRAITGLVPLAGGRVEMPPGNDISTTPSHRRVRELGICLAPEGRGILSQMSVEENLAMGAHIGEERAGEESVGERMQVVMDLFPVLGQRRRQLGGDLSGGEQQMLTIARALLMEPRVLLLDEPSMGLAPLLVEQILENLLRHIEDSEISVILVEQNTEVALEVSHYTYVIERGVVTIEGRSDEVARDPRLQETYLGL